MSFDTTSFMYLSGFANHAPAIDHFIIFLAVYLPYILVSVALLYIVFSSVSNVEKMTVIISASMASVLSRYGVTSALRILFHRPRPFLTFHLQPLFPENSSSFPSGHATVLFTIAIIIFMYDKRLGTALYCGSTVACVARVAAGVHYPSDILAGAIVGSVTGYLTLKYLSPYIQKVVGRAVPASTNSKSF